MGAKTRDTHPRAGWYRRPHLATWIAHRAHDRLDVGEVALLGSLANEREHLGLNIARQDFSRRPDFLSEPKRVVAAAGADVGHHFAGLGLQDREQPGRLFF